MWIVTIKYVSFRKDSNITHTRIFGPFNTYDEAFDWLASTNDKYDSFEGLWRWGSSISKLETPA